MKERVGNNYINKHLSIYNVQGPELSSKEASGANVKKVKIISNISYELLPKQKWNWTG